MSQAVPVTDAAVQPEPSTTQKVAAEVLGTFVLVFLGCGSAVYSGQVGQGAIVTIGLTFGLTVTVMAYAVGRISGGHFNPAVSVAAALGGRMTWGQVPTYVLAQLVGAVLGAAALFGLLHGYDGFDATANMGQNFFGDDSSGYAAWAAFGLEALLTFLFVVVILAVTDPRFEHPSLAPLAIGVTLAVIHFVAIPATGTSVNPARSIGPALFAGGDAVMQLWLFIVAPLVGAAIAGVAYPAVFGHGSEPVAGSGYAFPRPAPAAVPGYGAPDAYQQQWNQEATTWAEGEPIIQDGWQWDPVAQQWKPAEQPPGDYRPEHQPGYQPGPDDTQIRPS